MIRLDVASPEETEALGRRLAGRLEAGDLVILSGELGAGKTTFARGVGAGLNVTTPITSPTFVLARTHTRNDGAPLVHADAYRLASAAELDDLDIDFERSIVLVEWGSGLLDGASESWLSIGIERPRGGPDRPDGAEPRQVSIAGHGERWTDLRWLGAA